MPIKRFPQSAVMTPPCAFRVVLVALSLLAACAAASTRVVVPDIAGMIFPPTAVSSSVQFGDPSSSSPNAYEFVAPSADSVACTAARLCLELHISSEYQLDPFFLSGYDTNTPLVSATFDGYDPDDILPLIPGSSGANVKETVWWFQTNSSATDIGGTATVATSTPVIDLLLRLRQRSQRLSARDQLLVQVRVELVDSRTTTSEVQAYGLYGNQRVKQTTRRVDSNTARVNLSITRNPAKRDVELSDAYPTIESFTLDSSNDLNMEKTWCDNCLAFLDSCGDIEICNTEVMPCLLEKLELIAGSDGNDNNAGESGDSDPGSYISSRGGSMGSDAPLSDSRNDSQMDLLEPLAACVANLPISAWSTIRQALFCLAVSKCALGSVLDKDVGKEYPTFLTITNGSQKFAVTSALSNSNNVNLTIVAEDIGPGVADQPKTFNYTASASYLGMFLSSFVLLEAVEVVVFIEASPIDPSELQVSLTYWNGLMMKSVDFYARSGSLSVIDASPMHAFIEFPATSSRPNLDVILRELRSRVNPPSDTWILAPDCLSCSAQLFGCSSGDIANKSCNYNSMMSTFGQCIRQQLPSSLFKELMEGNITTRPISTEIFRCLPEDSLTTSLYELAQILSSLSCFAKTRCPFGPIALVTSTRAIVLETTPYIQLLRVLPRSSNSVSINIEFKLNKDHIVTTKPISFISSDRQVENIIEETIGVDVTVTSLSGNSAGSEWSLEIRYHHIFLSPDSFIMNAAIDGTSIGSAIINQVVMDGGTQLRTVPRNKTIIFNVSENETTSPSGVVLPNDKCRACTSALKRCQDNSVCYSFVREILVPSLRDADTTQLIAKENNIGGTTFRWNLVPTLEDAWPESFETWNTVAAELFCLVNVGCDMEYDSIVDTREGVHYPTTLVLDSVLVNLSVRTYPDTHWSASTKDGTLKYNPGLHVYVDINSSIQAASAFADWVASTINSTVPEVTGIPLDTWAVESTGGAVGYVVLYGPYDELINRFLMAPLSGLPTFSAATTGSKSSDLPPAEITRVPWTLSFEWSLPYTTNNSKPQYSKLLDMLRFGIDPVDSPIDTPAPSVKYISSMDRCRECKAATLLCQNSVECVRFSQDVLVPLIRNASNQESYNLLHDVLGHVERRFPLKSLYSVASNELSSLESWNALSTELSCFTDRCDLEYDSSVDLGTSTSYIQGSYLYSERKEVTLHVFTFNDTKWNMTINESELEYVPSAILSPRETVFAFSHWIYTHLTQNPYNLQLYVGEIMTEEVYGSAAFTIWLHGEWSDVISDRILVAAPLVPSFKAWGGTLKDISGSFVAKVDFIPWELGLLAYNNKPQVSKLLDLLAFGFNSDADSSGDATSSSSYSGPQSGSTAGSRSVGPVALSASDGCQQCVNTLRTCQIDVDCATVSRGKLSVLLKNALDTQNATPSADTPAEFEVDFASALSLLRDNAFTSKQTWFAIEDEFVCLGSISSNGNGCDVSYDDADNHKPSYLQVEKIDVILHVTTFQNTEWKITLNGTEFSYSPAATITNMRDAVTAFQSWLENWGKQESLEIHADSWDDDGSSPTTFDVKVYGNYDEVTGRYTMLSPALIPTFEAVGGIVTDNARNAGVSITLWDIKLKSTDPEPKYDKLLDLLGYGVVGTAAPTPAPTSTLPSPSHTIGSNDQCRQCTTILSRCQNDADCLNFSQRAVIPLLTGGTLLPAHKVLNEYGGASFNVDLYPLLLPLDSNDMNTPEAWNLVAAELYCLAYSTCTVEYSDVSGYFRGQLTPLSVNMDLRQSSVNVQMRTFQDTQWNISINGTVFSYVPDGSSFDIEDEISQLRGWFEELNSNDLFQLEAQVIGHEIDAQTESAILSVRFPGSYNDEFYQYLMVNPAMIPRFTVVGGTETSTDGSVNAGVDTTLPSLQVYSGFLKPQYSKLIAMLSYGIETGTPTSSTPEPTPTSASKTISVNDPCRQCENAITTCLENDDCVAFQTSLVALLGGAVDLSTRPLNDYGSARVALDFGSLLNSSVSGLSDSSTAWDALAAQLSCFNSIGECDMEYNDVLSPFLGYHVATSLSIEEVSIFITLRTSIDTTWNMSLGATTASFSPLQSETLYEVPGELYTWLQTHLEQEPYNLVVDPNPVTAIAGNSAIVTVGVRGQTGTYGDLLAAPWLIPRFEVTGGTAAEVGVTLWDVNLVSIGQRPQYGKLLGMLETGLVGS
ncbi:unnamed protein product [Phytophthora fragariaefolia]|uniref:Unnamed protein product n=1 Tax=Phytophthora fragariaefolia TaxID=1490495 RepID=A0A9W6XIQ0_9STRA|nr:unnamed protein product [Phytophthora fragariaefolia]